MKKISKSFVLSLCGGVILLLQLLGFTVDVPFWSKVIEAACAVLIMLGIVTAPKTSEAGEEDEYGDGDGDDECDSGADSENQRKDDK